MNSLAKAALTALFLSLASSALVTAAPAEPGVRPAARISTAAPADTLPPFMTGADVSFLRRIEELGGRYRDRGKERDLLRIFKDRGCNLMRLRVWVDPDDKDDHINSLAYTIPLAKRIKADGFKLLLDLHYSDTWADPGKQTKPAAWAKLTFPQLTDAVRRYSADVIKQMRQAGAMPDMVQVGNEITGGMLWPDGKDWGPGGSFDRLGTLLNAGIGGIREASAGKPPLIMIHIDRGADWGGVQWFYDGIGKAGVSYDVIGLSYYPLYMDKPLSDVKDTLTRAAERYKKPIVIVETAYPFGGKWDKPGLQYPVTPEGQKQYLADLVRTVRETPGGLGRGVIWWEPEWIAIKGLPSYYDNRTLFDDNWNALPALDELRIPKGR